jgi:hypothetical protein
MGDSHNFKPGRAGPGSRPGGSIAPAGPAAAGEKPQASAQDSGAGRSGRIVHDERGNAVWDWIKDTTRSAVDSTSRLLKKLEVPELKLEDTQNDSLSIESDRDVGGGYDPYGSAAPPRGLGRHHGSSNSSRNTPRSTGKTNDPGGGYDPYGKGVTRKPGRKF